MTSSDEPRALFAGNCHFDLFGNGLRHVALQRKHVTALFHASPAWATAANGFTSTPLAQGQFDQFNVFNRFVLPDSQVWLSRLSARESVNARRLARRGFPSNAVE